MIRLLRRKARSALWRLRHEWIPYYRMRIRGEAVYRLGRRFGPLRGCRSARPDEIVWSDAASMSSHPRLLVVRLKDAYVYRDESIVIASDYRLMADLSAPSSGLVRSHDVLFHEKLPTPVTRPGPIAVINAGQYDMFYHWMLETIPRFGLVAECGVPIDKYMVASELPFQRQCLEVLGITPDKVIDPRPNQLLQVHDLIAPSIAGLHGLPTEYSVCFLRKMFADHLSTATPSRHIYISRADGPTRRVVNEPDLIAEIGELGFEIVRLSEIPLVDQARIFSEARIVLGPHGAGMTHVSFMQPHSRGLIEFMPQTYTHDCFQAICQINRTHYQRMIARTVDLAVHDIEVDVAQVIGMVRQTLTLTH